MVALVAIGVLAVAIPASADARAYKKYAGCGVTAKTKERHVCPKRSKKGAFFKSFKRDVYYTICIKFPSGRQICANRQFAEKRVLYVNKITSTDPGRHKITWFVGGKRVGKFYLWVKA